MNRTRQLNGRMGLGLVAIAVVLHVFCCKWTTTFTNSSPSAMLGIENTVGVYAKHDPDKDLMLGICVPAALFCVGSFVARD